MNQTKLAILSIALLIGCGSNTSKPDVSKTQHHQEEEQWNNIKKEPNGTYSIIVDGKKKYTNLKYAVQLGEGESVEVLDVYNKKKILHGIMAAGCSFSPIEIPAINRHYKIVKKAQNWELYMDEYIQISREERKNILIGTVSKSEVDRIYFYDNRHQLKYHSDCLLKNKIYYQKGSQYGVLGEIRCNDTCRLKRANGTLFDSIKMVSDCMFKVKRNGLVGYLHITKIKYKNIGKYDKTLARFTLPDGRKGYVDSKGNEYYD